MQIASGKISDLQAEVDHLSQKLEKKNREQASMSKKVQKIVQLNEQDREILIKDHQEQMNEINKQLAGTLKVIGMWPILFAWYSIGCIYPISLFWSRPC